MYFLVHYSFLTNSTMSIAQGIPLCSLISPLGLTAAQKDFHEVLYITHLTGHDLVFPFLLLNVINMAKLIFIPTLPHSHTTSQVVSYPHLSTLTCQFWYMWQADAISHSLPPSLLTSAIE